MTPFESFWLLLMALVGMWAAYYAGYHDGEREGRGGKGPGDPPPL